MRKYLFLISCLGILFFGVFLLLEGCGSGGSGGGDFKSGTVRLQVSYPQDEKAGGKSDYPPPDYIAYYLIEILDPVTLSSVVETVRLDYPNTEANITGIPVGEVIVNVYGCDQYNYILTRGTSRVTVVADENSSVEISMIPVSPTPAPSPTPTAVTSPTPSPSPSPTHSPSPSPTISPSPSPSPTATQSPTPTVTPTFSPTPTPTPTRQGVLYVSNRDGGTAAMFNGVSRQKDDIAPNRVLQSDLNLPRGVAMDTVRNILYVCDYGGAGSTYRVAVYDNASTVAGNTSPNRAFQPSGGFDGAWGLFLDQTANRIYIVGNSDGIPLIYVYDSASTTNGVVTASRRIILNVSSTSGTSHIVVDTANDIGYINDASQGNIYVLEGISTADSNQTPNRTIMDFTNNLIGCRGLAIYNNTLYTVCESGCLSIFNNASAIDGSVPPDRFLSGANTLMDNPVALALDPSHGMMYVANSANNKILAYKNFQTIDGDSPPEYYIEGASTQLNSPFGLFVDTTRNN